MASPLPQVRKILFTTDLSQPTRHAFNYAVGIASQYGARLTILFVIEEAPQVKHEDLRDFLGKERWAEVRQSHEREIRQALIGKKRESAMIRQGLGEMLSAAQENLGKNRLPQEEILVAQGDVVECILEAVRDNQIDLVVMGYHARGRIEEAVLGSVSRSVLRKVDVPVLLVKLPAGE
jgi:nucleotide-binding universal stress UspA family protein